jgi:hypothetical protein
METSPSMMICQVALLRAKTETITRFAGCIFSITIEMGTLHVMRDVERIYVDIDGVALEPPAEVATNLYETLRDAYLCSLPGMPGAKTEK